MCLHDCCECESMILWEFEHSVCICDSVFVVCGYCVFMCGVLVSVWMFS